MLCAAWSPLAQHPIAKNCCCCCWGTCVCRRRGWSDFGAGMCLNRNGTCAFVSHRVLRCFLKKTCCVSRLHCTQKMLAVHFASFFAVFSYAFGISHRFSLFFLKFPRTTVLISTFCIGLPFVFDLHAGVGRWGDGGGVDDVHANAPSVLCFSYCSVFCALVGAWVCGVLLKCPGSTVPTLDFSHMPACTSM